MNVPITTTPRAPALAPSGAGTGAAAWIRRPPATASTEVAEPSF